MSVISTLGRLRQENHQKVKASLDYIWTLGLCSLSQKEKKSVQLNLNVIK